MARGLYWSGTAALLGYLPPRNTLLVLNYHRIGDRAKDLFHPGIISASGEEFDSQIAYLKRHAAMVTLEEAQAFIEGKPRERATRCRVLITFDDGYLDNYELAFPILRSHGAQGVFFLVTSMVGSNHVPWWDHLAFLMKTARQRRFRLKYPCDLAVDLDGNGLDETLRTISRLYNRPENADPERFMREIREKAEGDRLPESLRRFMNWSEAREMAEGGMAIGSHTHSHPMLSRLGAAEQRQELIQSRAILREKLGIPADSIAYPYGVEESFSEQTQSIAQEAGYRTGFSFYGGTNRGQANPYNIRRVPVDDQSQIRLRVQIQTCRVSGRFWP